MKRLVIAVFVLLFAGVINAQWTQVTHGDNLWIEEVAFADSLNGTATASGFGFYHTTNGGQTWQLKATWDLIWLSSRGVTFIDNKIGWITTYQGPYQGYFYKTTDAGVNWQKVDNGTTDGKAHRTFWFNTQVGFACGGNNASFFWSDSVSAKGLFWKTTNGGLTWTYKEVGKPKGGWQEIWMLSTGRGFLSNGYELYVTSDMGETWQEYGFSYHPEELIKQIHFFNDTEGLLFSSRTELGKSNTWVYRTTNGGQTWQVISEISLLTISLTKPVYVVDSNNIVMVGQYFNHDTREANMRILRSLDGGKTWFLEQKLGYNDLIYSLTKNGNTYWGGGLQMWRCDNVKPYFTETISDSIAYADSQYSQALQVVDPDGDQVTLSIIEGPSFLTIDNCCVVGMPSSQDTGNYIVKVLASDGKGGTDTLSYNLKVDKTTGVEVIEGIPVEYQLVQNYPNPFNPSTKIRYSIPKSSNVTLTIYNILGQQVTVLVNEYQSVGNYEYSFTAENLASGTYIYRLVAGNYVSTKKMVYVK
ncbi:T9SS type A sorting domain-containing protein [Patescibacteria group bacterium]|nr:T9SS type A sorting domain-containing protein [Patescibacteria group bacterium]